MYEPDMKLKKRELYIKLDVERGDDSVVKKIYELLFTHFHFEGYHLEMEEAAIQQLITWLLEDILDRHLYCESVKIAYPTGSKFYLQSFQKAVCFNLINPNKECYIEALCAIIIPSLNELLWVSEDEKREETFRLLKQDVNQVEDGIGDLKTNRFRPKDEQAPQKIKLLFLNIKGNKND